MLALLACAFLGTVLVVYRPALEGPFVSDDIHYVAANPYVHALTVDNVLEILSPYGAATVAVVNYSPIQLLLHSVAWELFGERPFGHHVLNCVLHAIASTLLVALLFASGLPRIVAVLGGTFFLLHPANVEAVAWISQLKSTSAMVLLLTALLLHPRRPGPAAALFGLSLLAKATAAAALPAAFLLEWARTGKVRWRWLGVWTVILAAYALIEFTAHQRSGAAAATLYETPLVLVRTIVSLAARYLAMATTSYGVSAFHEPEPAYSVLDPWWLAGLVAFVPLGWRLVASLRARSEEAGYWILALLSFGPVSQIFPFLYPLADRYLYFMLPGLIGGFLLAGRDLLGGLPWARRQWVSRAAVAVAVLVCVGFAFHSRARAAIWRLPAFINADAARNYPDGVAANLQRAKAAAQRGEADVAIASIRAAVDRGYNRYEQLIRDPSLASIADEPEFRQLLREIARGWIEAGRDWESPTQMELRKLASAHLMLGERERAIELLRRSLEVGGPLDAAIRDDLGALGASP